MIPAVPLLLLVLLLVQSPVAPPAIAQPYAGVTIIERMETVPRAIRIHVARVDLAEPGIRLALTGPGGTREAVRQTTATHVRQAQAQLGVNAHFFLPFPSPDPDANLIGLAASDGRVFSGFESPTQSYALVADAPAVHIDRTNRASIVHRDPGDPEGRRVLGDNGLWTAVSGSAQIVTDGRVTIPEYRDAEHPAGLLTPGGPGMYSNARSWYEAVNARTAIGLSRDGRTVTLVAVDARGGSLGMTVRELATMLVGDYDVWQALNLDGGESTSMVLADPATSEPRVLTTSADGPTGRAVASSLLVFARKTTAN